MRHSRVDDPNRPWPDVNIKDYLEASAAAASLGSMGKWRDVDGLHYDARGRHELRLELKSVQRRVSEYRANFMDWQLRHGMLLLVGYNAYYAELEASENGGVTTVQHREREDGTVKSWSVNLHSLDPDFRVVVVDARDLLPTGRRAVTFEEPFRVETTWRRLTVDLPAAFDAAGQRCPCSDAAVCPHPHATDGEPWDWRPVLRLPNP